MPHGFCYRWDPQIVWLHAVSDTVITISYYLIPLALVQFVRKRRDVPFNWMFLMFGVFIFGCGTTHLMEVWTVWHGNYGLAGVIKAITAASSAVTAALLVPLVPKAVALPSPAQLRAANLKLEAEVEERRRIEQELHNAYDVVHAILETVGALIIVIDTRGRIVRFNPACESATGFSVAEVRDTEVWDLFPVPEERRRVQEMFGQLFAGAGAGECDTALKTRDGEPRLISWSNTVLKNPAGKVTHVVATGLDITAHRRLERAVLDIAAKEQRRIGQDLHDDLGQTLTGIAFLSRALQDRLEKAGLPEFGDAAQVVALVNQAVGRTRELASGMSPVLAGAYGLEMALRRRCEETSRVFGIECRFEYDTPVPVHDSELAHHLYHIAQEALGNAIKHGKPSRVTINLSAANGAGCLSVADNGEGFEQGPPGATGLGRYTMEHRARIIGGSLEIKSAVGHGTVVNCFFQLEER